MPTQAASLRSRCRLIRLFLCDVDGVLTDGAVWMGAGIELKRFDIRDGLGLKFLQSEGIRVGWVSRRPSSSTRQRARDLKIDYLMQRDGGKAEVVEPLLRKLGLNWQQVCYVGDDVVDVGVLKRCGLAVAVADAVAEAGAAAHYIAQAPGGHGAIREVVELILRAQGRWKSVVTRYST